ncbi:uncharacterized protein LOC123513258 [Portunus trituberculatus]|uniref:uncharacterized protein LOC123513258 n=1 Tax=Portunus trituberculatus TaxID=210409 RepID=UPI001E1CF596|nr:uncharacterized protein LOC123513258 [Portunus trituberculatus]
MASTSAPSTSPALEEPRRPAEGLQKKRKADKSQWEKVVAKKRRDSGLEYVRLATKKVVAARKVGEPCECPKACFTMLGDCTVQEIFSGYWKMADSNAQSAYLSKAVISREVSDPRVGPNSRRKVTFEYAVYVDNTRTVVCKKAFLSIHSISERRVSYALKRMGETGVPPVDRRGKTAAPHNKAPDDVMQLVHDHIMSLPACTSYYSRAKSQYRVYLPPGYSHKRFSQPYLVG